MDELAARNLIASYNTILARDTAPAASVEIGEALSQAETKGRVQGAFVALLLGTVVYAGYRAYQSKKVKRLLTDSED